MKRLLLIFGLLLLLPVMSYAATASSLSDFPNVKC